MPDLIACVDVGGTFVDVALFEDRRAIAYVKAPNAAERPEESVLGGLMRACEETGHALGALASVVYATTLAINAVIEGGGAHTGMVTTSGFRDVLETRTEQPYDLYNPFGPFPEPLIPRARRVTVPERTLADGTEDSPLAAADIDLAADELRGQSVASVAVCLLNSYASPEHEEAVGARMSELLPGVPITLSSQVHPELGEYGRFSTAAVNAYILPRVGAHLDRLERRLADEGFRGSLFIVNSGCGMVSPQVAQRFPVRLLESGPAAGAVGVARLMDATIDDWSGDALSFDMGGTTAKVSIIRAGEPLVTSDYEVRRVERFRRGSGLAVNLPTVDIVEVGAGGGSIARVDANGLLAVGPESAAADPGPACYGRGGRRPTVTDADLILGYLDPDFFLGGEIRLSRELALEAVATHVAAPLGIGVDDAAVGIAQMVNANMAQALRIHSAEKGVNPRRSVLVAIGGAGPAHAWGVAEELGLREIVVPVKAGIFSALGCRVVPPAFDFARSYRVLLADVDPERLAAVFEGLRDDCMQGLAGAVPSDRHDRLSYAYSADLRYRGQRTPLTVPLTTDESSGAAPVAAAEERFLRAYEEAYGRSIPDVPIEAVTWRLRVEERQDDDDVWPRLEQHADNGRAPRPSGARRVHFGRAGFATAAVYRWDALALGAELEGPAVVDAPESCAVVPAGASARMARAGLVISLGAA